MFNASGNIHSVRVHPPDCITHVLRIQSAGEDHRDPGSLYSGRGICRIILPAFSMAVIDNDGITVFRQGITPANHPDNPDVWIIFERERV